MVVNESNLSGTQYLNILVGALWKRFTCASFPYNFQPLPCLPNADSIVQAIDDAVGSLGTNRNSFYFLLSDAARYMMAAGTIILVVPKLFDVTCIAHLLHNCVMKAKSYFHDVDQLIARIKAATFFVSFTLCQKKKKVEFTPDVPLLLFQHLKLKFTLVFSSENLPPR